MITHEQPPQRGVTREDTGYPFGPPLSGWFLDEEGLRHAERHSDLREKIAIARSKKAAAEKAGTEEPSQRKPLVISKRTSDEQRNALKSAQWRYRTGEKASVG